MNILLQAGVMEEVYNKFVNGMKVKNTEKFCLQSTSIFKLSAY